MPKSFPGQDRDGGYGWISIALHWLTAAAILVLLFAGDSIGVVGAEARNIHTTIATCAWAILAIRIVWRLQQGHPPRAPEQSRLSFNLGMAVHYILLVAIALMLASGPLAGWASGGGFNVFSFHVPGSPIGHAGGLHGRTLATHRGRGDAGRWDFASCCRRSEAHVRRLGTRRSTASWRRRIAPARNPQAVTLLWYPAAGGLLHSDANRQGFQKFLKNPKVTLADVAARAGMSQATASRALRGLNVHKKYQGKAEAAATELGYVLNESARRCAACAP